MIRVFVQPLTVKHVDFKIAPIFENDKGIRTLSGQTHAMLAVPSGLISDIRTGKEQLSDRKQNR